jgi:hypothetical protein
VVADLVITVMCVWQAAVSLVPSAASMVIKALKEPVRDRKKVR